MLLVVYAVVAIGALIVLRVNVESLDFMSIGWMLVLVLLPVLPWLVPRVAAFLKAISPYVQTFKLGTLQLDFRTVRRDPITVPSEGALAFVPNDYAALSSSTAISQMVSSLRDLRRGGGSPVGIIDVRDGRKWRLPNLYFLARLLELEPVVSEFVFTETRGGIDGFLLGTSSPGELRRQIEHTVPRFADASSKLRLPSGLDLSDAVHAQTMAAAFQTLMNELGPASTADDDPIHGWTTSERLDRILGQVLDRTAVDAGTATLSEADLRATLASAHRFVPAVASGRVAGLVDREAVALTVARATVAQA